MYNRRGGLVQPLAQRAGPSVFDLSVSALRSPPGWEGPGPLKTKQNQTGRPPGAAAVGGQPPPMGPHGGPMGPHGAGRGVSAGLASGELTRWPWAPLCFLFSVFDPRSLPQNPRALLPDHRGV